MVVGGMTTKERKKKKKRGEEDGHLMVGCHPPSFMLSAEDCEELGLFGDGELDPAFAEGPFAANARSPLSSASAQVSLFLRLSFSCLSDSPTSTIRSDTFTRSSISSCSSARVACRFWRDLRADSLFRSLRLYRTSSRSTAFILRTSALVVPSKFCNASFGNCRASRCLFSFSDVFALDDVC